MLIKFKLVNIFLYFKESETSLSQNFIKFFISGFN